MTDFKIIHPNNLNCTEPIPYHITIHNIMTHKKLEYKR